MLISFLLASGFSISEFFPQKTYSMIVVYTEVLLLYTAAGSIIFIFVWEVHYALQIILKDCMHLKLGELDVWQSMLHGPPPPENPPRWKEILRQTILVNAAYYLSLLVRPQCILANWSSAKSCRKVQPISSYLTQNFPINLISPF